MLPNRYCSFNKPLTTNHLICIFCVDKCIDHSDFKIGIVYEFLWAVCEVFHIKATELFSHIQANGIVPPPQLIADVRREAQGHSTHSNNRDPPAGHD